MSGCRVVGLRAPAIPLFLLTLLALPVSATGQVNVGARGSTLFESYKFSQSFDASVDRVSELSVPLTLSAQLSRRTVLTVATGYARVSISGQGRQTSVLSGVLDTELRLAFQAVRDRITIFTTSSFPTGKASVGSSNLSTLGVIASDVIGPLRRS